MPTPVERSEKPPSLICVDDDRVAQTVYQRALGKRGYSVRVFGNGIEALNSFDDDPSDVVVLDLRLPGMNGLEMLAELRRREAGSHIPVIIVSSEESEEAITEGLSLGADDYMVKPVKPGELTAKIGMLLKKRQLHQASYSTFGYGSLFNRRYRVIKSIASGGSGSVYRAEDTNAKPPREVALKIMRPPAGETDDQKFLAFFSREAYAHSRLDHPNIARLYDFGQVAGTYYLAMEFLDGLSVASMVNVNGPMTEDNAVLLGYEVAKAFYYLEQHQLVHRDIKPDNIIITSNGEVKLCDFGLSKNRLDSTLSLSDEFRGTPQYVAPEVVQSPDKADVRSDVYSLGVTLYFAASGQHPIAGKTAMEILRNHLEAVPVPLRDVAPVSPEFAELIHRMLAKNPRFRPGVEELAEALLDLSDGSGDTDDQTVAY